MEGTKACAKCGEVKPLSAFPPNEKLRDGHAGTCWTCEQNRRKEYQKHGRKAADRKNPMARQMAQMIKNSRKRAKQKGIEHDIDVKYLRSIATTHCPYLGVQLRWEVQSGTRTDGAGAFCDSPSLDRIDPSKGYVRGNVAIVSYRANAIKNNATEYELFRIGRALSLLKAELAFPG